MTTKIKFAAVLAALTLAASVALPTSEAQAKPKWGPFGVGLLGAAVVGTAIAATTAPVYADGYRRCWFQPQYDVFGNYIGSAQVCRRYY